MVLTSAVDAGVIPSNPQTGLKVSRKSAPSRAKQALTAEELERLAVQVERHGYCELVLVMGYAGLRPNEAFALRRRHLDDFGNLLVNEGLVQVRGRLVETDGKTHAPRVVPLAPSVLAEVRAKVANLKPDELMFLSPRGRPIGLRRFRDVLCRAPDEGWAAGVVHPVLAATHVCVVDGAAQRAGDDRCCPHGTRPGDLPTHLRPLVSRRSRIGRYGARRCAFRGRMWCRRGASRSWRLMGHTARRSDLGFLGRAGEI